MKEIKEFIIGFLYLTVYMLILFGWLIFLIKGHMFLSFLAFCFLMTILLLTNK